MNNSPAAITPAYRDPIDWILTILYVPVAALILSSQTELAILWYVAVLGVDVLYVREKRHDTSTPAAAYIIGLAVSCGLWIGLPIYADHLIGGNVAAFAVATVLVVYHVLVVKVGVAIERNAQ